MHRRDMISIWFFIGLLLLVYGVIILASSALVAPVQQTAMSHLHADIWWGALLIVLGALYAWVFRPGRP